MTTVAAPLSRAAGSSHRQHGVVLVVSLLILLVLTLLGVVAMNTTTMEERMAGNTRMHNLAFQWAEAGLRDGEADLVDNAPAGFDSTCTTGLCLPSTTGTPVWADATVVNWSGTTSRVYGSQTGAAAPTPAGQPKPRYILEKMPPAVSPGQNLGNTGSYGANLSTQLYRVTSRATAENGNVTIELQSVYLP